MHQNRTEKHKEKYVNFKKKIKSNKLENFPFISFSFVSFCTESHLSVFLLIVKRK